MGLLNTIHTIVLTCGVIFIIQELSVFGCEGNIPNAIGSVLGMNLLPTSFNKIGLLGGPPLNTIPLRKFFAQSLITNLPHDENNPLVVTETVAGPSTIVHKTHHLGHTVS